VFKALTLLKKSKSKGQKPASFVGQLVNDGIQVACVLQLVCVAVGVCCSWCVLQLVCVAVGVCCRCVAVDALCVTTRQ